MDKKLRKYKEFLNILDKNLQIFFDNQKEFIKCSAGCSHCCESGYYPVTNLEFDFLKTGFDTLDAEKQDIILKKCNKTEEDLSKFIESGSKMQDFAYECPILNNGMCSLYEYRPILCRVYGLITPKPENSSRYGIPACKDIGLNYANVWDEKINNFSYEKAQSLNIKGSPEAFDVAYESLLKKFEYLDFGDIQMLFKRFR